MFYHRVNTKMGIFLRQVKDFFLRYYVVLFFIGTLFLSLDFAYKHKDNVLWSDAEGYYMYLPAVFIYNGFVDVPVRTPYQFGHYPNTDKYLTKYTCGVAIMELPFFLSVHALAAIRGEKMDGYSNIYIKGVLLAAAFYVWVGFFFLSRVLRRKYSDWIVLLTVLCLYLGTNLFYYTAREGGMSHAYSFCLFSIFIYLTPRFYKKPKIPVPLIIGMALLSGLIVLIRPTNIIILLYLFFYNITSWQALQERFRFYISNLGRVWIFPVFSFLVFIPQFMYWHYLSGNYVIYSYGEEGFTNWAAPKVFNVLLHIKNGMLIFSPMLGLALLGLVVGVAKKVTNMRLILVLFLICLYLFASWWCWWFGGGFGHRSFVEFYTFLAFPMAYLLTLIYQQRFIVIKIVVSLLLAFLIYYNQGLTYYKRGPHYTWKTWNETMENLFPILYPEDKDSD